MHRGDDLAQNLDSSLLHSVDPTSEVGSRYAGHLARLTSAFVYNRGMTAEHIRQEIQKLKADPAMRALEGQEHRLEAYEQLFKGVEAHDVANEVHEVLWQEVLRSRPATDPKHIKRPEDLTREEVAIEFKAFPLADDVREEEDKAITAYRTFLKLNKGQSIQLDSTIKLEPADIQILVIDLEVRKAERILDPKVRAAELASLNEQLLAVADSFRPNPGKRFEVMELYMLRRLIQAANTGHIASVRHGTPREDLKRERAIDLSITAAGKLIQMQLKTFDPDPAESVREVQEKSLAKARRNLEGTPTHLGVLATDDVKKAFLLTQEEPGVVGETTLHEKQAAFEPLFEKMGQAELGIFRKVLGLTPERLAKQLPAFQERERQRAERKRQLEEERARAPEEAERRKAQQAVFDALRAAERERQEAEDKAHAERLARALKIQQEDAENSRKAFEEKVARENAKLAEVDAKLKAQLQAQQEAREAEARSVAAVKAAETRALNKLNTERWPPTPSDIKGLLKLPALVRLEFLTADQANNVVNTQPMLEAKRAAVPMFADPKIFKKLFPTKAEFEEPTAGVLQRVSAWRKANGA